MARTASRRRTRRARGFRRLSGLDRSGPSPTETRRGQPLRPFTLPNLIGYLRLAGIPVFLYLAFESGDGRSAAATIVFAAVTAGDYVDGLVARATGQYSRMGALLDPVVDRLAVLAGAAVCWHFELLPRWALAALAARELVTLALAQAALRRGLDLDITWIGRVGVLVVMSGLGLTLIFDSWVTGVIFILGLAVAVLATVLYARAGLGALRSR